MFSYVFLLVNLYLRVKPHETTDYCNMFRELKPARTFLDAPCWVGKPLTNRLRANAGNANCLDRTLGFSWLLVAMHLLLVAMHLFLIASCYY